MKRVAFVAAAAAAVVPHAAVASMAFDLVTPTGTISGTLTLPAATGPSPVVLIVAGSGPTDRDGNSAGLRADSYRLLADALAAVGIASVRYDKRGIGLSASAMSGEATLRFEDLVADAAGWLAKLVADTRFGTVAIAGHSEGSLIGMLAAQRGNCSAFVSLAGPGFPAADELRRQLAPQLATSPELAAASDRILTALVAGRTADDVPQPLMVLYRPSVQPYLISWFRYDPRVVIAKLEMPCTIVQGTNDVQIPVADARALAAAQPRAKLVLIDGLTHVLKDASAATVVEQIKTVYQDPSLPIDPGVVRAIAETLRDASP